MKSFIKIFLLSLILLLITNVSKATIEKEKALCKIEASAKKAEAVNKIVEASRSASTTNNSIIMIVDVPELVTPYRFEKQKIFDRDKKYFISSCPIYSKLNCMRMKNKSQKIFKEYRATKNNSLLSSPDLC